MRKGRCRFWNDAHHNAVCDAGVRYGSVTPSPAVPNGIMFRYPCFKSWPSDWPHPGLTPRQEEQRKQQGHCDKYTEPTDEDIAAFIAEGGKLCCDIVKCAPLFERIRKEHKGKVWDGKVDCPVCNGKSTLYLRHAPNTHIWVKCETAGCIHWVQ